MSLVVLVSKEMGTYVLRSLRRTRPFVWLVWFVDKTKWPGADTGLS